MTFCLFLENKNAISSPLLSASWAVYREEVQQRRSVSRQRVGFVPLSAESIYVTYEKDEKEERRSDCVYDRIEALKRIAIF